MSGTIWGEKIDYSHWEKEFLSCVLPSYYWYHWHNLYKKQKKSLECHSCYNFRKDIFIACTGHQNVMCPRVQKGAACIARGKQGTVPEAASLHWRCLRVRMVPTITMVIEVCFHDESDEVTTSQFLYFGHGVLGLESFANLLITAKMCNRRNWNRMGLPWFFGPQLSSFTWTSSSRQCRSSFGL